ncbi:MAG: DUF2975 domain-containing protein [Hyphomicrobium sp.]
MTIPATLGTTATVDGEHAHALRRLGAGMCCAVAIGGALAEIALAWVWLFPDYVTAYVVPHLGLGGASVSMDGVTRALGFAVSMLPLSVLIYALHQAYELFDGYRLGRILNAGAPVRLRRIGFAMLALALLRPLANTLLGLVLTASNPEGQRILAIQLSIDDYMIAIFGGLILAIGHAMAEAARIADDHRQIV